MAYTKLTDYAAKDNLTTGNPSKVVKGSEIGADFDAIVVDSAAKDSAITALDDTLDALITTVGLIPTGIQAQSYTKFATGGSATAFTLTPTPAIAANTAGYRLRVVFSEAAGASPTLAVSGKTALNLKYYNETGNKEFVNFANIPSGWETDVECDGTDWVVLNPLKKVSVIDVKLDAQQSVSSGVATKVSLNVENLDTNSEFASYDFTPTVPGYYLVEGCIAFIGTSITSCVASIYKNTGVYADGPDNPTGACSNVSCIVYLNGTTDYVSLYGTISSTGPKFNANQTRMCATFLRG